MADAVGIEAMSVYSGVASLTVKELFRGRRLDPERIGNLMMESRSIALPFEDAVTHAVNAAKPIVDALSPEERSRIEVLVTSSESGVDYAKSIASYAHEYLGLSRNCRFFESKQACYAATAAIQLALGYLAAGISPGAKVLVVATDLTLIDARGGYAEPAMGAGGVAVLLSDNPKVMKVDLGAFGNYSYDVFDTARPNAELEVADVDRSLFTYLDCFSNCYQDYARRVDAVDLVSSFDYFALHTPFAGLVKAAHRKLMREVKSAPADEIAADFQRRVAPSLVYPARVGNMCSGSVYLALTSVIEKAPLEGPARVAIFSYGSGCASEFFTGVIDPESAAAMRRFDFAAQLDRRCSLSFEEYEKLLEENVRSLVAVKEKEVSIEKYAGILERVRGRKRLLALKSVKDYHRRYDWI